MATLNKVMLIGNLTRDPETRYTPKGTCVASFGIAVNRTYFTEAKEKMQETTFLDITAWSGLAETVTNYLRKGACIYVEGRLQQQTWDDKETGQKRSKIIIVAENIQFLDAKKDDASTPRPMTKPLATAKPGDLRPAARPPAPEVPDGYGDEGDEIPF